MSDRSSPSSSSSSSSSSNHPSVAYLFFYNHSNINKEGILQSGPITMIFDYLHLYEEGLFLYQTNRFFRCLLSSHRWSINQSLWITSKEQYHQYMKSFPQSDGIYIDLYEIKSPLPYRRALRRLQSYKQLRLSFGGSKKNLSDFFTALCHHNQSLEYVQLKAFDTPLSLLSSLGQCPNIEYIDATFFNPWPEYSSVPIGFFSFFSQLKKLKTLIVNHCEWVNGEVLSALTHCPLLKLLDIGDCPSVTNDDINNNIPLMKSLTTLDLSNYNDLRHRKIIELSKVIDSICSLPLLTTLKTSGLHFDDPVKIITTIINQSIINKFIFHNSGIQSMAAFEQFYSLLLSCKRIDCPPVAFGPHTPLSVNLLRSIAQSNRIICIVDLSYCKDNIFHDTESLGNMCLSISRINGLEKLLLPDEAMISKQSLIHLFQCKSLKVVRVRVDEIDNDAIDTLINNAKHLEKMEFTTYSAYDPTITTPPAVSDDRWYRLLSLPSLHRFSFTVNNTLSPPSSISASSSKRNLLSVIEWERWKAINENQSLLPRPIQFSFYDYSSNEFLLSGH